MPSEPDPHYDRPVRYRIDIMEPGHSSGPALASFCSTAPFMRLSIDDMIDPSNFTDRAAGQLFKVRQLVHGFELDSQNEISLHFIKVFTTKIFDCASVRAEFAKPRR